MDLRRRHLLALLSTTVAGCGEARERAADASAQSTPREQRAEPPSGPTVSPQSVSVGNARSRPEFVTVAVEYDGATAFVESRELVPGERRTVRTPIDRGGTYDVVVETASGDRTTGEWDVATGLDGLSVTLTDGIDLIRTVRCGPDCRALVRGDRLDEPLVGDGSPRWYAPARVVLRNPAEATAATLSVTLDGTSLVDARYRVAGGTQVVVPLTYRSGVYRVAVSTGGERVAGEWRVPEEPSRVVDLATLAVGCGPANTELRVENRDDDAHTLVVTVERDGSVRFTERYRLDPGARRAVVPVTDSGRYGVRWRLDGEVEGRATWWSCPPHGPATIRVDATGTVTLSQEGGGR